MKLKEWINKERLTLAQAWEIIGIGSSLGEKIVYKGHIPKRKFIDKIAKGTKGEVTLKDWQD